eukprot:Polyplicarium_translucidae@DN3367_c0_g4_i1.p1
MARQNDPLVETVEAGEGEGLLRIHPRTDKEGMLFMASDFSPTIFNATGEFLARLTNADWIGGNRTAIEEEIDWIQERPGRALGHGTVALGRPSRAAGRSTGGRPRATAAAPHAAGGGGRPSS